jgi:hypothetical protein
MSDMSANDKAKMHVRIEMGLRPASTFSSMGW